MQNKIAKPTKAQFELQTKQFKNELANITEENANLQIQPNLNPIKWVAGHVLNTRFMIIKILTGAPHDPLYLRLFGKGSTNKIDATHPTLPEIITKWDATAIELIKSIEQASEETLMAKPPFQTSIADETMLGLVAYLAIHEAHHIGQLSILKKLLK